MHTGDYMSYLIDAINGDSPLHKHKNYEIIAYTNGSAVFISDGKKIEIKKGQIAIVPPGTGHCSIVSDSSCERIYINGDFNHCMFLNSTVVVTDNVSGDGLSLAKMIYENRHSGNEYITALINAFVHFLLGEIKMESDIFLAIKEIVDKISNDFHNSSINLNTILKKSGYAEDYIRSEFKKVTGKTPTMFLTEIRIKQACYLMDIYRNILSLSEIAEKCGYTDYVYFSRRFRQIMGVSPRKYMEDK